MQRSITFLSLALLLSGSVACSSSDDAPGAVADTGSTTTDGSTSDSVVDTGKVVVDSGSGDETSTTSCAEDLATDYACPSFPKAAPSAACSEAVLQDFAAKCVVADFSVGTDCAAWKAANAACSTCVEAWSFDTGKVYPDDWQCYEKISAGCGGALSCENDCYDTVCSSCADEDYGACADDATKSGGRCYDLASKKADMCRGDMANAPCNATQYYTNTPDLAKLKTEVVRILRGACRDNGDFSKSDTTGTGGDAGPTDGGSADAGSSDAASGG